MKRTLYLATMLALLTLFVAWFEEQTDEVIEEVR